MLHPERISPEVKKVIRVNSDAIHLCSALTIIHLHQSADVKHQLLHKVSIKIFLTVEQMKLRTTGRKKWSPLSMSGMRGHYQAGNWKESNMT
jgi:hypothetical protein